MTIYLDREEHLLLTLLNRQAIAVWALSGMLKPEWAAAFNRVHKRGLVTLSGDMQAYGINDEGRAALLAGHGLSFFDMAYRAEDNEDFTW